MTTNDSPSSADPRLVHGPRLQVPVVWQDQEDPAPIPTNAFMAQLTPDGVLLIGGFARPPILSGSEAEQRKQAQTLQSVSVRPIVRLLVPYHQIHLLAETLARIDEAIRTGNIPGLQPPQEQL